MNRKCLAYLAVVLVFVCLIPAFSFGEGPDLNVLLTGEFSAPVLVTIQDPQYKQLAQFDPERRESLNRLLRHFSLQIRMDEDSSESVLSMDEEPLVWIEESVGNQGNRILFSLFPDGPQILWESADINEPYQAFEEQLFFPMNRLCDGLYSLFLQIPEAFSDLARSSEAALNYSGFGRAVKRTTVQFSSDFVSGHFPETLAALSADEFCKSFLSGLVFSGVQKIVLYFDQDESLIRVTYDGNAGFSSETVRRVSLNWKCLRKADQKKDSFTLKTPAVKSADRDNFTYERDLNQTDPESITLKWDLQTDQKSGQEKTRIRYSGNLHYILDVLTGEMTYQDRSDSPDTSCQIVPQLKKEENAVLSGPIEIIHKKGKIINRSFVFESDFRAVEPDSASDGGSGEDVFSSSDFSESLDEWLQNELVPAITRKIVSLPDEDTDFLRKDIPDEIWQSILPSPVVGE